MFNQEMDVQHHPLRSWAQATISRESSAIETTKENLSTCIQGVLHTHHRQNQDDYAEELVVLEDQILAASNTQEIADLILDARPLLDEVFLKPTDTL
ncbi:hypothetical protein HGO40_02740 [Pseudomonas sp. CG7]|uniref:hypothetical protein n=1 Tax=Pseudomonas sp. CG7 TaxID=191007 RepID=UPI0020346A08|nr:hypothetical protein [Pseudomonas sp. CG7]MCM2459430.1 hypothetical protein [Pseudomonas sp. CG7]